MTKTILLIAACCVASFLIGSEARVDGAAGNDQNVILSLVVPGEMVHLHDGSLTIYRDKKHEKLTTHKVTEVGLHFVRLSWTAKPDDDFGPTEICIPLHAIKSIVVVNKKGA